MCLSIASLSAIPQGINTADDGIERMHFFALGGTGKLAARLARETLCARDRAMGRAGRGRRENRATESMVKPGVAIA